MNEELDTGYGVKVSMFISEPKYMGTISDEEAKEEGASIFNFNYGGESFNYNLTFNWAVDTQADTIRLARYSYAGVPSGIAVHHMVSLLFTNKTMNELDTINYAGLEKLLRDNPAIEALPSQERFTITFAVDATKLAVKSYIKQALSYDDKTIPCTDSPMSISSIKETIRTHNIQTLEELGQYTLAGTSDTSSHETLLEWLEENKIYAAEKKEASEALAAVPFNTMSVDHQIIAVETAIDNTVRQFLVMDGGDIDILNVKENSGLFEVYISYLGACSSCESAGSGTLMAIENALKDKLDPNIKVIAI